MSTLIHPTAIVHENANVAPDVKIGPYSIVGEHVTLSKSVELKAHVNVDGHTYIGENTVIYPFASIGSAPQDLKYAGEPSELIIGKNNVIREHVTMNPGTKDGGMKTVVGDNCLFMVGAHVAHDCIVGNNVILANNATLAGHVTVGDHAIIGGLAAVHQFIRIGAHAMIGGMSGVEADVIPYGRVKGDRANLAGLNIIGMSRRGYSKDQVRVAQKAYAQLFADEETLAARIEAVHEAYTDEEIINTIIDFARADSKFPLCQPKKNAS